MSDPADYYAAYRDMVRTAASIGIPQDKICQLVKHANGMPISVKTLRANFREELDTGMTEANVKVAKALYDLAISPEKGKQSVAAAIFWLKCRAGWRETTHDENEGVKLVDPDPDL